MILYLQILMNVNLFRVNMEVHVQMVSTPTHVNVWMVTLVQTVRQV